MASLSRRELKRLTSLQRKKYRLQYGQCMLEGLRLCEEALASDWTIQSMFVTQEFTARYQDSRLFTSAQKQEVEIQVLSSQDMDRITGTKTAQGVVLLADLPPARTFTPRDHVPAPALLLDGISDPGNLGTLLRSAEWFGVPHIILGPGSVEWSNPKVLRSTMGAVFRVHVYETEDWTPLLKALRQSGYRIFAADLHGRPLQEYHSENPADLWALILGNEAHGISPTLSSAADTVFTISGAGGAESLNVAMAGTVFLYEFQRS